MAASATGVRAAALLLVIGCASSKSAPVDAGGPVDAATFDGALPDAAGDGDGPDALSPRITKGTATRDGVVGGFAIDDETEVPVPAQVLVNGVPAQALVDGSFTARLTAGRAHVELRSDGYLPDVREVVAGRDDLPLPYRMAQRAAKRLVGPAGGTFDFRGSTLLVPAGAYASDTPVSLTYLSRTHVATTVPSPQFIDDQGVPRRALVLLDLASDAPPASPVRVRVPLPADAAAAHVSGFVVNGGRWTTAVAPDEVVGGFAVFTLKGAGQLGVAADARQADGARLGYLVVERGDTDKAAGDVLLAGTEITTIARPFAFVDPRGTRVEVAPGARVRLGTIEPTMPPELTTALYRGRLDLLAGRARALVPLQSPPLVTLVIVAPTTTFAVTSSAALTVATCGPPPDVVDAVEVLEGAVTASAQAQVEKLAAGDLATTCAGCPAGAGERCLRGD